MQQHVSVRVAAQTLRVLDCHAADFKWDAASELMGVPAVADAIGLLQLLSPVMDLDNLLWSFSLAICNSLRR